MKLWKIAIAVIVLVILAGTAILVPLLKEEKTEAQGDKEILFQAYGKSYKLADIPGSFKQKFFDIEQEKHDKMLSVIDELVLSLYLDEEAKKKGISKKELESQLFGSKSLTDEEAKDWYEKNKASMPNSPPFEQVKEELKRFLNEQKGYEKKGQLLLKVKTESNLKIFLKLPEPPVVEISTAGFISKGNPEAKITIVEFADYKCGHCKRAANNVKNVVEKYKDKVKFFFVDFPLQKGGLSFDIAVGAFCANKQNKFWEYHYLAFAKTIVKNEEILNLAKEVNLNQDDFNKCIASDEAKAYVSRGRDEGDRLSLQGTPTIYFNGSRINGYEEQMLTQEIEKRLK